MALLGLNRNPTAGQLRWGGLLLACFLGVLGALARWRFEAPAVGGGLWLLAAVLGSVYYLVPRWRRAIFVGWQAAAYPLGWLASQLLLAVTFYLVVTPTGLIGRLAGRDPLARRPDPGAGTYWIRRERVRNPSSYFRQY